MIVRSNYYHSTSTSTWSNWSYRSTFSSFFLLNPFKTHILTPPPNTHCLSGHSEKTTQRGHITIQWCSTYLRHSTVSELRYQVHCVLRKQYASVFYHCAVMCPRWVVFSGFTLANHTLTSRWYREQELWPRHTYRPFTRHTTCPRLNRLKRSLVDRSPLIDENNL